MGIARSTYYAEAVTKAVEAGIVAEMKAICDEFEAYGYRRVDAELRHRGYVVNSKKVRRPDRASTTSIRAASAASS